MSDHYIHIKSFLSITWPWSFWWGRCCIASDLRSQTLSMWGAVCSLQPGGRDFWISQEGALPNTTAMDSPLCGAQQNMNHQGFAWQTPGMDQTCPESPERMALQVLIGNSSAEVTYLFIQPLCGELELQHGLVLTYLLSTYLKWMVGSVWINGNYIAHLLFCLQWWCPVSLLTVSLPRVAGAWCMSLHSQPSEQEMKHYKLYAMYCILKTWHGIAYSRLKMPWISIISSFLPCTEDPLPSPHLSKGALQLAKEIIIIESGGCIVDVIHRKPVGAVICLINTKFHREYTTCKYFCKEMWRNLYCLLIIFMQLEKILIMSAGGPPTAETKDLF